jgi:outer membrane receptor protein involved in Fe transport
MKRILTLTLLLFSMISTAQLRISGKVIDEKGNRLKEVMIVAKSDSTKVLSGKGGRYAININSQADTLVFSKTGYQHVEIGVSDKETVLNLTLVAVDPIHLSMEEILGLVITTAGKKEEKITDIPASVLVMGREEILKYGFSDLQEIFSHIAGLYFVNNASFLGPTIGVRGYMTSNPTNIVVMLNGVPQQNDLFNSFSFHQTPIPVEAIERIEVVRGPMSVIYGSNAFFGAINIITNYEEAEDNMLSDISISKGNFGKTKAVVSSYGKAGPIDYSLSFSYNKDDGINKPFTEMISNFSNKYQNWGFADTLGSSEGYFTTDQKYTHFSGKYKNLYFETAYAASKFGQTFSSLYYLPAQCKMSFSKTAIGYRHEFSEKLSLNTKISYSRFDLLMENNYYTSDTTGFGNENDMYSYGQYWSEKAEAELNLFYSPNPDLNLSLSAYQAGILDVGDKTDAPHSGAVNLLNRAGGLVEGQTINISAFYGQADYTILERINVLIGGRLERMSPFDLVLYRAMYYPVKQKFEGKYTDTNFKFVHRMAVIAKLNPSNYLKFMYGEAIKMPAVWELRNNLTVSKSLVPEKIKTFELNYLGNISVYVHTNISLFKNLMNNIVSRSIIFADNNYYSYFTNGVEIETNGIEFSVSVQPSEIVKTEASVVLQQSKYKSTGMESIDVEFSPKLLAYFKALYQLNKKFSVGLTGQYVDKMFAQWDNTPVNPGIPGSPPKGRYGKPVDPYFVLSTNLRYENINFSRSNDNKGMYIQLKLSNLLDQKVQYASTSVSAWADKGMLGFGRSFLLSAGYHF